MNNRCIICQMNRKKIEETTLGTTVTIKCIFTGEEMVIKECPYEYNDRFC